MNIQNIKCLRHTKAADYVNYIYYPSELNCMCMCRVIFSRDGRQSGSLFWFQQRPEQRVSYIKFLTGTSRRIIFLQFSFSELVHCYRKNGIQNKFSQVKPVMSRDPSESYHPSRALRFLIADLCLNHGVSSTTVGGRTFSDQTRLLQNLFLIQLVWFW